MKIHLKFGLSLLALATVLLAAGPLLAQAVFTDVTSGPLGDDSPGNAVAWGDYDRDGDLDIFLANVFQCALFRNEGNGSFVDATGGPLIDYQGSFGAAWGDYDNDGNLDLYLAKTYIPNKMFHNLGDGTFEDVTSGPLGDDGYGVDVGWSDYDLDGDIDLYLANLGRTNKLFRNEGGGTFVDATTPPLDDLSSTSGVAWGDFDNDGDPDLYLANLYGPNKLFRNDGNGQFTDVTTSPLDDPSDSDSAAWGDFDNDGDLDLYVGNQGPNKLFRNEGNGTFIDVTSPPLGYSYPGNSVAWGDFDNDGDLDLYTATAGTNKLFRNDGGGSFVELIGSPIGDNGNGLGAAWGDYDDDGDLDLYLANDGSNHLFRNESTQGMSWLKIDLVGVLSNRDGIGARIILTSGGVDQIREISAGSGGNAQNSLTAHFGLGTSTAVDQVVVRWPSGTVDTHLDVAVDQTITLVEGLVFTDATTAPLDDAGSGRGVAWGDYDGDGAQDLYLVNSDAADRLFHNEGDGTFTDATAAPLGDTGPGRTALWGDYDNDGDLDLYLVRRWAANRLFRNEGNGFVEVSGGPQDDPGFGTAAAWGDYDYDGFIDCYVSNGGGANILLHNGGDETFTNTATGPPLNDGANSHGVAWSDIDGDGDLDLFLSNYSTPPWPVYNNRLMRNNGGGSFTDIASAEMADPCGGQGVAWGDYDNDGDLDLYMANEGPNKLFRNDGAGSFTEVTAPPLDDAGFGRGVGWADFDNDGDLDLYLVNTGSANRLFLNDGGGAFIDVASGPLADDRPGYGMAWADYDADGDLDIYLSNAGQPNLLLRNDCANGNHWLHVDLVGTLANKAAIGVRVRVVAGALDMVREISGGSSYLSQNSLTAEFGLGAAVQADLVEVSWPSGLNQRLANVAADQRITITEEAPYPIITQIADVPDDQGGWVRLHFNRAGYDRTGETEYPIFNYGVYRRIDDPLVAARILAEARPATSDAAKARAGERSGLLEYGDRLYFAAADPAKDMPEGLWEAIGTVMARQQERYVFLAPTLGDLGSPHPVSEFFISAYTTTPGVWFDGPAASGSSVDNIAPGVPQQIAAAYVFEGVDLTWAQSPEDDFQYFRIYRGSDPGFVPTEDDLLGETIDLQWSDPRSVPGGSTTRSPPWTTSGTRAMPVRRAASPAPAAVTCLRRRPCSMPSPIHSTPPPRYPSCWKHPRPPACACSTSPAGWCTPLWTSPARPTCTASSGTGPTGTVSACRRGSTSTGWTPAARSSPSG